MISAILLAAGLSRRMGSDKLLLMYKGLPLLQHAVDLLNELPVFERIIVSTEARLEHVLLPSGISTVINRNPEAGQSSSIKLGVEAATGTHYLFLAADQPKLKSYDIKPILEVANANPDKIIFPPTLFPNRFRSDLLSLTGDVGGRIIRDANIEECIEVRPECPENFTDIDSMEDYYELI